MSRASGHAYAVGAFLFWGLVPVYWKRLAHVPALESLLHRVVWSAALLILALAVQRRLGEALKVLRQPRLVRTLAATTLLIGANWFLFIWAVNAGRLVETSLGYFMNPLVNVVLGMAFLGERLTKGEIAAVALAGAGVANLLLAHGAFPWISLSLALSFGFYGLLRKSTEVDALVGLTVETTLLAAPCAAGLLILAAQGRLYFMSAGDRGADLLLLGTSIVTTVPLLWFNLAARRIELKAISFAQYLSPTGHLLLAVAAYGEPLRPAQAVTFGLIWAALAVYSLEAVKKARQKIPITPSPA